MVTSPIRVLASVVAVAILAFSAVRALPDPAPVPAAEGPAPSAEAPAPAPPAEKRAPPPATGNPPAAPEAKAEQLDQLLAPIALYPDALLAQILMAATYPLEIVKADRWLQDPAHANLQGDQLAAALEAEAWDPSVKSLVPFPRILRMMDAELDWTEQLDNAVVAQQADVMDAIQRLRHQAAAAGTLWSNAEQQITTERQGIVIEPANPELIYPPVYTPAVYGPWPYPDYPPLDISPDDYGAGSPVPFGIGFGVGVAVVQPLWRWCVFDWAQRRINSTLRSSMPSITAGAGWEQTLGGTLGRSRRFRECKRRPLEHGHRQRSHPRRRRLWQQWSHGPRSCRARQIRGSRPAGEGWRLAPRRCPASPVLEPYHRR